MSKNLLINNKCLLVIIDEVEIIGEFVIKLAKAFEIEFLCTSFIINFIAIKDTL